MAEQMEIGDANDLSVGGRTAWARPPLPPINPEKDSIALQTIEMDYTVEFEQGERQAVLHFYGINMQGNSVLVHIHGFYSYFFIPAWDGFVQSDIKLFGDTLNEVLAANSREKGVTRYVRDIRIVRKQSLWGYQHGMARNFIQVFVSIPAMVATSRRLLENGFHIGRTMRQFQTYESNIAYVLRFMVDKDIRGGGWVEFPAGSYRIRPPQSHVSRCQLEMDVFNWTTVISHLPEGEWLKMAPLRVLSFDIECAGRKGFFPTPQEDPVIQIANVIKLTGSTEAVAQNVFTLNTCAAIVGSQVLAFKTEQELLMAWKEFLIFSDPDIITGYNIVNFDLPYLLDRAKTLKLTDFPFLGRIKNSETTMKDSTFQSKAQGIRESKDIRIDGRIQFDILMIMRRDFKLRSYTLNAVCADFLMQQKEDVHHSIITDLQNGTDETRRRLAVYCIKDAQLPLRLMEKLMLLVNHVEMARVTGVPISFLLTRGQQIKVVSQLYRKALQRGFVVPVKDRVVSDEKFEGATVIEPEKGYYADPIATLDFASLYPSIMQAHNLCYTTLIGAGQVAKMSPETYTRTPTNDFFVKSSVQKGLLPEILEELLEARKRAKKDMAKATDPMLVAVLNGRQLALKISANSVYGFTGAQVGQLPCLAISSSVTGYGREMIERTKEVVEKHYTIANGYEHDAKVIYGDTDSVMVKFGTTDIKEAMRLGHEAAEFVSKEFIAPIKLEFEKVYYPYLLMNKKRYAGLYWTKPDKWDKMDTKGIETVRRDNCGLVKNVVTDCLNMILIDKSVQSAIDYAKQTIADLLQNKCDLSLLVITKNYGKANSEDYANTQAHIVLAERMRLRDPSTAPTVGDRVAYVMIQGAKGAAQYEKAEDPLYVLENDIPIDVKYYLENQLRGPLQRIFEAIVADVDKTLFEGDHVRSIKKVTSKTGGLMKFTVKTRTCLGCKAVLKEQEQTVCKHCEGDSADLYIKQMEKVREHEELFSATWTQCQRCQGSLHQDILCSSRDCPIFYRRKKVQKDLAEAQAALDRFAF